MKSKFFFRAMVVFIFSLAQLMIFDMPACAQKSISDFTVAMNEQANMLRLPVEGSDKYLEISVPYDLKEKGEAEVKLPGDGKTREIRPFQHMMFDQGKALGLIGTIGHRFRGKFIPIWALAIVITSENGEWEVVYQVLDENKAIHESGRFPLTGVEFYKSETNVKTPVYSTSSPEGAREALFNWAVLHTIKR